MDLRAAKGEGLDAYMDAHRLDAVLFPGAAGAGIAARAGYPSVQVPAGFASGAGGKETPDYPLGATFTGRAWSEPTLLRLAYAFEQAVRPAGRRLWAKWPRMGRISSWFRQFLDDQFGLGGDLGYTGPRRAGVEGVGVNRGTLRSIARHGMTKGAAFFYAVAVGAGANFVLDYVHHHQDVTPVVAHETVTAPEREHPATVPIARPEPRVVERRSAEPRVPEPRAIEPRVPERPTTASLPPMPEVRPLPAPTAPVALPQVPRLPLPNPSATTTLPPSSDLPTPPLKPASMPSLDTPPAADKPIFSVPPAAPAAASAVPPVDKPVEAMSIPTPPVPSIGNPVSLLPPPDKPAEPPAPKNVKPGSGTRRLY